MRKTENEMKNRLREVISYKTNGRQTDFAKMMSWSQPYLAKLLTGESIGLKPLLAILQACPEIDARWLLTGEGEMFGRGTADILRARAMNRAREILDCAQYLPVMNADEIDTFARMLDGAAVPAYDSETKLRWIVATAERQMQLDYRIKQAINKSDELCRQQTAQR